MEKEEEIKNKEKEMKEQYDSLYKSDILKAIKKYLSENNRKRTRADGFGRKRGNGLERPKIGNVYYSWRQFARLKKDVVLVYAISIGCDYDYIIKTKEKR
ncbi:MAG: hypothetical protein GOVbin1753_98 [Prokaryotic dsDNA virus sp.]|nr:MAG: hypothetical protein GOVbin1753_98 [Prokaryotic dsDNA virus sp.]|tara:strand:+ start:8322 stop:8621 length:300 start_codon:yes stop_codon:yes gene_type:complete